MFLRNCARKLLSLISNAALETRRSFLIRLFLHGAVTSNWARFMCVIRRRCDLPSVGRVREWSRRFAYTRILKKLASTRFIWYAADKSKWKNAMRVFAAQGGSSRA